ncbi:hypothetical protein MTR_1g016790 [Medicago truncatula]|uniref:Uncharacterized protein n=1 Tax=Medicago truncatula TaxID=3880 RepID=A0A072VDS3_MEDTR|nr:hypothetical protein MTR_1g016790 [Medicago truncatula]
MEEHKEEKEEEEEEEETEHNIKMNNQILLAHHQPEENEIFFQVPAKMMKMKIEIQNFFRTIDRIH